MAAATTTTTSSSTPRFAQNDSGYRVEGGLFSFERNFDQERILPWMLRNWTLSLWSALAYVVVIFALRRYMRDRPRFDLRLPLVVWNTTLAVFSVAGAWRTVPELVYVLRHHGLEYSVCNLSYFFGRTTGFWSYAFTLSKLYELGDTLFVVLRKQPLIFLHWYHHVTVMTLIWYSYVDYTATGRWIMAMNFTVHSFMYTYYAARASRLFVIPRFVNVAITCFQIAQMLAGMFVVWLSYRVKSAGVTALDGDCHQTYETIVLSMATYSSYFVLFARYFYVTYVVGGDRSSRSRKAIDAAAAAAAATNNNNVYDAKSSVKKVE